MWEPNQYSSQIPQVTGDAFWGMTPHSLLCWLAGKMNPLFKQFVWTIIIKSGRNSQSHPGCPEEVCVCMSMCVSICMWLNVCHHSNTLEEGSKGHRVIACDWPRLATSQLWNFPYQWSRISVWLAQRGLRMRIDILRNGSGRTCRI